MYTYIILTICIAPFILAMMVAGIKVNMIFKKYNQVKSASGLTASECARRILDSKGLYDVQVLKCKGNLSDHYDPRTNNVYLSESVYNNQSVSAIGVAAHEVGHAIQHSEEYLFIKVRTALVPICNITSRLSLPLILIGLIIEPFTGMTGASSFFFFTGTIFYGVYTLFTLITLPVEFNASNRARELLLSNGFVSPQNDADIKKVLKAAANTYVMSFALSLLYLLRYIAIFGGRRRD